jgi:hypothetical protein
MILAMGAISMTAGMWNSGMLSTVVIGTLGQHIRAVLFSTAFHGPQRFLMTW